MIRRVVRATRTLRFRIAAAFLAALIVMIGMQGYLLSQQEPVSRSLRIVRGGYLPLSKTVARLARDHERVERDIQRLMRDRPRPARGDSSATAIFTDELRATLDIARIHVSSLRSEAEMVSELATLNKISAYLDTIERLFREYDRRSTSLQELMESGHTDKARDGRPALRTTGKQLGLEISQLERVIDDQIEDLTGASERAQARATRFAASASLLLFGFTAFLIAAVIYALRPIGELTTEVQRLAAGEYGGRVKVRGGGDEIGALAAEFNAMASAIELRDRQLSDRAAQLDVLSRYLTSVVDSLDDGLVVVEGGAVTLTNPASARLWGTSVGEPAPETLGGLVQTPGRHQELHGGRHLEVRTTRFGDSGAVAVTTDITDQVAALERLARSERLALVGQMLAQITHEVRNPLNALSLNAELLGDELGDLDPERRTEAWEILAMIANEVDRLTDVTGHYLQLARRPPARLEAEALPVLLEEVVRLLEPELEQLGVALSLHTEPLPLLLVDGNQLRQAVLNVIRNATEAGARTLDLRLVAGPDEVRIVLEDDGPGMTAAEAERATDPFFSTKAAGTGLGLAITRQILEDHDGRVDVDSTPGHGTTIALVLPARHAEHQ